MRKLTAGLFMTLDGVVETPDAWQGPYFNDEVGRRITAGIAEADALLMGTSTYRQFAGLWTSQESNPMADLMNSLTKYVVSSSLTSFEWANSVPLTGDFAASIDRLKRQEGKTIQVPGSPRLVRSLLGHGLLDELNLMIHPIVLGTGMRLFEDTPELAFEVTDSTTLSTGVVAVTYRPVPG
ncbi:MULTISPECIES: dihydrofolate reductase family protein [Thermomonosporaceae]|uniref:dihydrofolate reductase family protein n=1 Tax=Thermomonosporaceae TaxID=2012 RepID=UPI00255A7E35|nr:MULTISPECIES: dihydrofolate reductase family protein [Thermomonosporaceae]MDL4775296.1 dihydrofolate reductase family protein [Actinomadura xylanilytica]